MFENFHPELDDQDIDAEISSELVDPKAPRSREVMKKFNVKDSDPQTVAVAMWTEPSSITAVVAKEGKSEKFKSDLGHYSVFIATRVTDGINKGKSITENLNLFPKTMTMTWEELRALKASSDDDDPRRSWSWAKMQTIHGYQRLGELMIATGNRDRLTSGSNSFRGLHTIEDLLNSNGADLKGLTVEMHMQSGGIQYDGTPEGVVVTRIGVHE